MTRSVHPARPVRSIPQNAQSRKDPSRDTHKFTNLENLILILFRDSLLRTRPAVQIHDGHFYLRGIYYLFNMINLLINWYLDSLVMDNYDVIAINDRLI